MRVFTTVLAALLPCAALGQSVADSDGYTGYKLDIRDDGDPEAVVYETANTTPNVSALNPEPDVMLNASVHVGEIYVGVDNLTAKINLDAQVLSLLQFNAGVDLSIDKVSLTIQNVTAKVYLEARLGNLVKMVGDVLDSIDLNPIIAELGNGLGSIINDTAGLVGDVADGLTGSGSGSNSSSSAASKRSEDLMQFDIVNNILFSKNDFSGNTHTRRVLKQNGDIVELNVPQRKLHLHISDEELARRLAAWVKPAPPLASGYWKLYVDTVLQADQGVDLEFLVGRRGAFVPRDNH